MAIDQRAPTDLSPDSWGTSDPDLDLLDEFGGLIWNFCTAFMLDPNYLVDIVEAANHLERRYESVQRTWKKKLAAQKVSSQPHQYDREGRTGREWVHYRLGRHIEEIDGHWLWHGSASQGTPFASIGGSKVSVRKWAVEQVHGEDGSRWMVTAGCGERLCVEPDHATWKQKRGK